MKRWLILTCCCLALAAFALTLTRVISAARAVPSTPFVQMLESDLQPVDGAWCWRGLCPGKATATQAARVLADGVFSPNLYGPKQWKPSLESTWSVQLFFEDTDVLYFIALTADAPGQDVLPQISMANVVMHYGEPTMIGINADVRSVIYACYAQGLCVRSVTTGHPQIRLHSGLDTISLIEPQYLIAHVSKFPVRVGWQGFADYLAQP